MNFFKSESMRRVDRDVIASGTPGEILMSRASRKLAGELLFFSENRPRPVIVLCGPGNNGGDGFGLAALLHGQAWPVEIWNCAKVSKLHGDAEGFFRRAMESGVVCRDFSEQSAWDRAEMFLQPGAWLVDALLGTGSTEAPRGVIAAAVRFLREHRGSFKIWSVDLPSGLDADQGKPFDPDLCVQAEHTLTLGGGKTGFAYEHSSLWTGAVSVLDLGIDPEHLQSHADPDAPFCLSDAEASHLLPEHSRSSHKGTRGHLLLIGGSSGMTGSISLSAQAACVSGCGMVSILTPFSCAPLIDAAVPEAVVIPGNQGKFMTLSNQNLEFSPYQAVGVGPGLRVNYDSIELVVRILRECEVPLVLDADALNCMATLDPEMQRCAAPLWLTPHPGEMACLMGLNTTEILENRTETVACAAAKHGAMVLLKGDRSRMYGPHGRAWINLNGNPGMAKGGSG
ncbi:MAG: NAD(P)H-hydrate dehydratase, partial [Kiritimatiellia bacterium]